MAHGSQTGRPHGPAAPNLEPPPRSRCARGSKKVFSPERLTGTRLATFLSGCHHRIAHSPTTDESARDARQRPEGGASAAQAECSLDPWHLGRRSCAHRVGERGAAGRQRPDGDAPEVGRGSLSLRKSAPPCRLAPIRRRQPGGGARARSRQRRRSTKLKTGSAVGLGGPPGADGAEADPVSFPLFGLRQALESVGTLWPHLKATAAPADTAVQWLGYGRLNRQRSSGWTRCGATGSSKISQPVSGYRSWPSRLCVSSWTVKTARVHICAPCRRPRSIRGCSARFSAVTDMSPTTRSRRTSRARLGSRGRSPGSSSPYFATPFALPISGMEPPSVTRLSGHPTSPTLQDVPRSAPCFTWPLGPEVSAELRLVGEEITRAHLERLRQYVELASIALDAEPATPQTDALRLSSGDVTSLVPRRAAEPRRVKRSVRPGR